MHKSCQFFADFCQKMTIICNFNYLNYQSKKYCLYNYLILN